MVFTHSRPKFCGDPTKSPNGFIDSCETSFKKQEIPVELWTQLAVDGLEEGAR